MKRIIALLMALVMCLSLCACGGTIPTQTDNLNAETYYNIGDTISTDLFSFTLDAAALAIALENTHGEDFGNPKEYNPQEDNTNPYVAPTGHTYAAFTYTVQNIGRASEEFHSGDFVQIIYKDKQYKAPMDDVAVLYHQAHQYYDSANGKMGTNEANTWYSNPSNNMLVGAAEMQSRKAYADFDIEADSLTDAFHIRVTIPSSKGVEVFTYQIPASN